jgi:anti-anti-sigma factor
MVRIRPFQELELSNHLGRTQTHFFTFSAVSASPQRPLRVSGSGELHVGNSEALAGVAVCPLSFCKNRTSLRRMGRQQRHPKQQRSEESPPFGVGDCIYNGVCIIRAEGPMASPAMMGYFRKYFDRKINEGIRFFILDCDRVKSIDSSGVGAIVAMSTRASMRSGKFLLLNISPIESVLQITKLITVFRTFANLETAFEEILQRPVPVPQLTFEERFLVKSIRSGSDLIVMKADSSVESFETESPFEESPAPVERLSIKGMAGVAISALAALSLMILGLVWVTRQISSIPLLVLIFSVALLFSLCLIGLLLLLSGHLSEKMTVRLLNGVLAKIPSLGSWVPKVLARKVRI